jgi:hypothetical protein
MERSIDLRVVVTWFELVLINRVITQNPVACDNGKWPINAVVSMGRRNAGRKSNLQMFQRLNSFESADSKKTLPCLGLIEYSPKDQVSLRNTIGSTD